MHFSLHYPSDHHGCLGNVWERWHGTDNSVQLASLMIFLSLTRINQNIEKNHPEYNLEKIGYTRSNKTLHFCLS